ncbi:MULTISPECIES: DUF6176 family protein [Bacilli]|jgi:hypothetical protein|uniref:DUF6176 family protein n=2 Tax=Bacilli TaxID=91061 RepID=A0AAT9P9W2_9STAP|nr:MULTISPECIES: DUF6176 family protein [Macrococcus]NTM52309.1 hypothetical protein [Enterococcus faecium]PKE46506.1 hypothetical protein CW677_11875 [Macrococcus caseolyticus]PKF12776.1 hypothetical protein CW690_11915 [Macrococcus caseolyticus]QYA34224.1 hypothetical protein KYI10_12550 [Macrococcus sp. 19Msa1099]QYA39021.1 hypothetical protein KYI07_12505 [Macrococcus caseolyticus]
MNIELTKFKVKKGKTDVVEEWLNFLNKNMKDVLITLENEKMYVESIFKEKINEDEYLYWFSVQGEGGQEVETSEHWIDKKHLEYWNECIDSEFKPVDLDTRVVMIPEKVRSVMK